MDTRFWGPSGWRLLHLIAAAPLSKKRRPAVKEWFELLEYILPCKYCRASFHDYIARQPLTTSIVSNPKTFSRWLYDIHNRVNAKLRDQGLLTKPDPSWSTVRDQYSGDICKESPLQGWDFMTSIAYSSPDAKQKSSPMYCKEPTDKFSFGQRNRYNLLTQEERIKLLARWWALIPSILPCETWRAAWAASQKKQPPLQKGREAVLNWLWIIEESVCSDLKCPTPHPSLPAMKNEISVFESDCGSAKKGKTCRTRKHRQRRLALSRRRDRYSLVQGIPVGE